jgi:hypothetical protein
VPGPSVWLGIAVVVFGLVGGLRPRAVPARDIAEVDHAAPAEPPPASVCSG